MSLADRINPSVAVFQYGTDLLAATITYFSVVSCLEPPHETSAIQPTANTTMCLMFMTASRCGNYISNDVTEDNVSRFEVFAPHARPARAIHSPINPVARRAPDGPVYRPTCYPMAVAPRRSNRDLRNRAGAARHTGGPHSRPDRRAFEQIERPVQARESTSRRPGLAAARRRRSAAGSTGCSASDAFRARDVPRVDSRSELREIGRAPRSAFAKSCRAAAARAPVRRATARSIRCLPVTGRHREPSRHDRLDPRARVPRWSARVWKIDWRWVRRSEPRLRGSGRERSDDPACGCLLY